MGQEQACKSVPLLHIFLRGKLGQVSGRCNLLHALLDNLYSSEEHSKEGDPRLKWQLVSKGVDDVAVLELTLVLAMKPISFLSIKTPSKPLTIFSPAEAAVGMILCMTLPKNA